MNKEAQKLLVVVAGVGFGVLAFLAVLGFIVSDQCLDSGGAVGDSWFVCLLENETALPWFLLLRPAVVVWVAGFVAVPLLFIGRSLLRRIERKYG